MLRRLRPMHLIILSLFLSRYFRIQLLADHFLSTKRRSIPNMLIIRRRQVFAQTLGFLVILTGWMRYLACLGRYETLRERTHAYFSRGKFRIVVLLNWQIWMLLGHLLHMRSNCAWFQVFRRNKLPDIRLILPKSLCERIFRTLSIWIEILVWRGQRVVFI